MYVVNRCCSIVFMEGFSMRNIRASQSPSKLMDKRSIRHSIDRDTKIWNWMSCEAMTTPFTNDDHDTYCTAFTVFRLVIASSVDPILCSCWFSYRRTRSSFSPFESDTEMPNYEMDMPPSCGRLHSRQTQSDESSQSTRFKCETLHGKYWNVHTRSIARCNCGISLSFALFFFFGR